jgi:hypothetical protein
MSDGFRSLRVLQAADAGSDQMTVPGTRPPRDPLPEDVEITGDEPTTFDPTSPQLTTSLPENTALLCVTAATGEPARFRLHFHFAGSIRETGTADLDVQTRPTFSLAEIARRRNWKHGYHHVMDWWVNKMQLATWMADLLSARRAGADATRLVVWDNTDFQIPWELHWTSMRRSWLGAEIEVVRWTSIYDGARVARYAARPQVCRGGVLAMESATITPAGPMLGPALRPYGVAAERRLPDLLQLLDDEWRRFALLLIRCHGAYDAQTGTFELDGMQLAEFEDFGMPALGESRAVVLLNACETGVVAGPGGAPVRGFAEVFLRRGASSVIATASQIGLDHSHEFAVTLLRMRGAGQRLSRLMLDLRRDAARRAARPTGSAHPDLRTGEDFEAFFYAFTYVHFGHPDTVLELVADSSDAGRGG